MHAPRANRILYSWDLARASQRPARTQGKQSHLHRQPSGDDLWGLWDKMCVPMEHPFPSINPARRGTGPCGGGPPTRPCRPIPALRLARRRGGVDAGQEVDVRVGRHRGELLARRPRVPRVRVAPPEHRLHALDRRQPPVVAQDGPGCEFTPPSILSCRCAWSDRRSRGNKRPSWAPLPKGYLTVPEKVIYRGNDRQPDTHSVRAVKSGHGI